MPEPDLQDLGQAAGLAWEALQSAYSAYQGYLATGERSLWKPMLTLLLARSAAFCGALAALLQAGGEG